MSSNTSQNTKRKIKHLGVYTIGPEIGKGSFAIVYKCIDNRTNLPVAIKSVVRSKLKSKKLIENLEIEISILKSMKHPHIVALHDCTQTTTHFHLVMDYCSMGDLSYFIRKRDQLIKTHPVISSLLERYPSPEGSHGINKVLVIHFLKQLASALEFLREKSLVHRDIKPQNLLLCPPVHTKQEFEDGSFVGLWELPILKIADFGFARFLPSTSMAETLCGSPLYMAPEILRYEKYNAKADLWSVGAVLYEMTVGKPPFKADNHVQLLKNIEKSNDKIKFPSVSQVPESLKRLIKSLLKCNPTERISFNEFFQDPLILEELTGINEPLERSEMDENLFISEYISPIKPISNSNDESKVEKENKTNSISNEETKLTKTPITILPKLSKSKNESDRDEEIKNIINKNSPGQDIMANSIQPINKSIHHDIGRRKDDIILEKDYVVVEKRAVEVNAIADELANAGSGAVAINPSIFTGDGSTTEHKATHRRSSLRTNSMTKERRPSLNDRRISISISPTNALSKAIGLASNRLFGAGNPSTKQNLLTTPPNITVPEGSHELVSGVSHNPTYSTVISSSNFVNKLLLQRVNLPTSKTVENNLTSEQKQSPTEYSDELVLSKLEAIATKSHAINLFADVKFSQLIPSPPSEGIDEDNLFNADMLPPKIVKSISEEGLALYVKTLSILAQGMATASKWWYEQTGSSEHLPESRIHISTRINELVQWIREKFNECLEKAEFIRLRLEEAEVSIRKDFEGGEGSNFEDTNKVIAEKLIFDRALEISRNAAVNELVKEDLKGCELAYSTAIWMLEALIDEDCPKEDEKLDQEDKAMVEKFIVSIGNRLSILKKKLESLSSL